MTIEYTEGPHKTLHFCRSVMTPLVHDKMIIRRHFQPYNIIIGAGGIVVDRPDRDSPQCKESEESLRKNTVVGGPFKANLPYYSQESYDFKMYCKYMEKILLYFYSVFSTNQV